MPETPYEPAAIEPKWQSRWEEAGLFRAQRDQSKPKYYILTMFPYPSGALHMGHVVNYTIGDALARYHMMRGYDVLSPMGWDSFGLPAENAAIRLNVPPDEFTRQNIDKMRAQMRRAGWGYDWAREVATSHPGYYKWTQWLFLRFFENGLAVKKRAPVNWCSSCQTVLANEQVIDGVCERCNTPVEQRDLDQWFFTMSKYAERLLKNHDKLRGGWPDKVLKMQSEWIGRSEGARVNFTIAETGETLSCFTTRPDTLYGVTFMCLAPEHPIIEKLVKGTSREQEVMDAVRRMRRQGTAERERAEMEKAGVFTGCHVVNPVNGEKVPLWVANFAVMSYGTGAVMSVPAHDQRDFEFARKYAIPIKVVIQPEGAELDPEGMAEAHEDDGVQVNSGPFDGLPNREAMKKIAEHLADNGWGEATVSYRLRDWLLSRQRYWGAPIPIVHCEDCGPVGVPNEDLPVELPKDVEFRPPSGESPLATAPDFVNAPCPRCGKPAKRETDTMDTFVDSSWYFLRYLAPREESAPFNRKDVKDWMPVDQYVGGIEHATMHLIYFRFFTMVLHDLGLVHFDEPVKRLFCQGMICKVAHFCPRDKWLPEEDVEEGRCKKCGGPVQSEVTKMSKTKLNTVSPDEIMSRFGADTLRFYILSDAPPERDTVWKEEGLLGASRFINRLWSAVQEQKGEVERCEAFAGPADEGWRGYSREGAEFAVSPEQRSRDRELLRLAHSTIKHATEDIDREMHFNTAIARMNELLGGTRSAALRSASPPVRRFALETLVKLIGPISPHIAEELWEALGRAQSVFRQPWPECDEACLKADEIEVPVQVNGKMRGRISVPADAGREALESAALGDAKVKSHIDAKTVRKVIVIERKLVNIVAN